MSLGEDSGHSGWNHSGSGVPGSLGPQKSVRACLALDNIRLQTCGQLDSSYLYDVS